MKFFALFTYCTAAIASVVPLATDLTNVDVQVRNAGEVFETADSVSLAKLLSRDSASAYEEARRAAGRSLSADTYYYFMNCNEMVEGDYNRATTNKGRWMMDTYSCSHVGLVVGKTSWLGRKFKAHYIHIRTFSDGLGQTHHDYNPYEHQRLIWGGKTTESKANLDRLVDAGRSWLNGAMVITEEHNCMAHYEYLASLL